MYKSLYRSHIRVNPVKRMSKSHHTQSIGKIMYVNYSLVMFRFWEHNAPIVIKRHMKTYYTTIQSC